MPFAVLVVCVAHLCAAQEPPKLGNTDVRRRQQGSSRSVSQPAGKAAYDAFTAWRNASGIGIDQWDRAIKEYRRKLINGGLDQASVGRTIESVGAYGEAELYDSVYARPPAFNAQPNRLLVEAVKSRAPGRALDIAMGQGRNAVYLATQAHLLQCPDESYSFVEGYVF